MNSPTETSAPSSPASRAGRASTRAYGPNVGGPLPKSTSLGSYGSQASSGRSGTPGDEAAANCADPSTRFQPTPPAPPRSPPPPKCEFVAASAPAPNLADATTTPALTHTRAFPTTPTMSTEAPATAREPMTPQRQVSSGAAMHTPIAVPDSVHRVPSTSTTPATQPPASQHHHHHHHHHGHSQSHHQPRVQKRTSVGPWDFVKSVGAGSMGQVKLAVNRYTRQSAAVKIVPKAFTQKNWEGRESNDAKDARVIREAAIGKLVYHPNISRLYEVYSMSSHYYLVFEYIAGGQMLDYIITHGSVKETQARRFARSIASSLDYCHRNSIVHRDLKIENILIADGGDIKIIDFGLSNLFRRDDLLKTFCGSLYFAAPELLNALPYVGPEVDVWSFGVVLYVLVCGKVPFEDKSMAALHAKIKRGEVEYPTWLSPLCTDLLSKMLVVSPSERATMRDVIHHPWMNKGFDSVVECFVPDRVPLELPLDGEVLNEMVEMSLAKDIDFLRVELEGVLQSPQYLEAVAAWYDARASSSALPSRAADPLNSYHPFISMYFLTRERLEREAVVSSSTSLAFGAPMPAVESTPLPPTRARSRSSDRDNLPTRAATTTAASTTSQHQRHSSTSPAPPGRRAVTGPVAKPAQPQLPSASQLSAPAPPAAAGRLRSRTVGTSEYPGVMYPELAVKRGFNPANDPGPTPPISPQVGGERRSNLSSLFRRISLRRRSGRSDSNERSGDISVDGLASQHSSREPSRDRASVRRVPSRHSGNSGELSGQDTAGATPQSSTTKQTLRVPGHTRAKSTGYPGPVQATDSGPMRPSHSRQPSHLAERIEEEMPSIESPRQVFFKGFFSVQSTSTKSLREIRAEIIRVLTELSIDFVEIKGGFACIHGASPSSTAATTLPVSVTSPRQPAHRRGPSFGASPPHASPSRPSEFSNSSSDSVELTGSDMLGHEPTNKPPSPVRFEISIVRVPLLSLHGVQFKKLTGDMWRYKSIAQEILEHLKL